MPNNESLLKVISGGDWEAGFCHVLTQWTNQCSLFPPELLYLFLSLFHIHHLKFDDIKKMMIWNIVTVLMFNFTIAYWFRKYQPSRTLSSIHLHKRCRTNNTYKSYLVGLCQYFFLPVGDRQLIEGRPLCQDYKCQNQCDTSSKNAGQSSITFHKAIKYQQHTDLGWAWT